MKRRARDIFNQLDYQYLFKNLSYKSMQIDIPTLKTSVKNVLFFLMNSMNNSPLQVVLIKKFYFVFG